MQRLWKSTARHPMGLVSLGLVVASLSGATASVKRPAQSVEPPLEMGQAVFAAVSEIVSMLQDDPNTDWSSVDIAALREHLVDMDRVMGRTLVTERPIENGVEITVTGPMEVVDATRRMVGAHAAMGGGGSGTVSVTDAGQGIVVAWTTTVEADVAKLRGLGFYGFLVEGSHHRQHHLMIATGADPHGRVMR